MKGNKGEWSELYAFLKLLSEQKMFLGDKNLERVPDIVYPIVEILRNEHSDEIKYQVGDGKIAVVKGDEYIEIDLAYFKYNASILYNSICAAKSTTFEVEELETFASEIKYTVLKQKPSIKSDLRVVIHDTKTAQQENLGFSIKSRLGGASTLFNASGSTNFIFRLKDIDGSIMNDLNGYSGKLRLRNRIKWLACNNHEISYLKISNIVFQNNLILIDSLMPMILAEMIKVYYKDNVKDVSSIVTKLEETNPLGYDMSNSHRFYEYKVKKFLVDSALGMVPGKVWNGVYDSTGGYLVVKEDGDVLSYHIFKRNEFEDYLFYHTCFDTPSSSRHGFGDIYDENDEFFLKLNFQIRFK